MRGNILALTLFAAAVFGAACTEAPRDPSLETRLDFLKPHDATRAYVLDSRFDLKMVGVGPIDPPYEPGANQLTVLGGIGGQLYVDQAIDLGEATAVVFGLSPDGDTALVGTKDPPQWELAVVRGLRVGPAYVAQRLPLPWLPSAFAFAPDGTTAFVGSSREKVLEVAVVTGLPESAAITNTIGLGVNAGAGAGVNSLDLSLDGRRLLVQSTVQDRQGFPEGYLQRALIHVVADPAGAGPGISAPLELPTEPALPPQPPFAGLPTGVALGDSAILGDGDSAIVPCSGTLDLGQPDARIFLLTGVRSGALRIARTLTPDDGVRPSPFQVSLFPDGDRALVSNTLDASVTIVSGLSEPGFASVRLDTFPVARMPAAEPSVTPDGRVLVVLHKQPPIDGSLPAAVSNYSLEGSAVTPLGAPLSGPVRAPPYWKDATLETFQPGLSDGIRLLAAELPAPVGALLQNRIDAAVRWAAHGRDEEATAELRAFQMGVRGLEQLGELTPIQAEMLDTLAQVGVERLK
jgi:hypothetical protein